MAMSKLAVISRRSYAHWHSRHLVDEWEDELVKAIPEAKLFVRKEIVFWNKCLFNHLRDKQGIDIDRLWLGDTPTFSFDMSPILINKGMNKPYNSVCIIDFFMREGLDDFYSAYSNVKHLWVSSREVYDYLQSMGPKRQVEYMPLTLPDKYRITPETKIEKKYDVIMQGRQSKVLLEWLEQYAKTHDITYVRRGKVENNNFPYYNNRGEFVGFGNTREQYLSLLRGGRIAFYTTSGCGGDNRGKINHGFHQVTPRFLEEISCGCNVVSFYEDNSDTDFFELSRMSRRVDSYSDFEKAMDASLSSAPDMGKYSAYLERHYTSVVAKEVAMAGD